MEKGDGVLVRPHACREVVAYLQRRNREDRRSGIHRVHNGGREPRSERAKRSILLSIGISSSDLEPQGRGARAAPALARTVHGGSTALIRPEGNGHVLQRSAARRIRRTPAFPP